MYNFFFIPKRCVFSRHELQMATKMQLQLTSVETTLSSHIEQLKNTLNIFFACAGRQNIYVKDHLAFGDTHPPAYVLWSRSSLA